MGVLKAEGGEPLQKGEAALAESGSGLVEREAGEAWVLRCGHG